MKTIIYQLDEFRPLPRHELFVYGHALIEYDMEPPDRSVGYRGGPAINSVVYVVIDSDEDDGDALTLTDGALFHLIAGALCVSEHVIAAIERQEEAQAAWDF